MRGHLIGGGSSSLPMPQYILERATVKETGLPAKQIARFYRVGVGTLPLRKKHYVIRINKNNK